MAEDTTSESSVGNIIGFIVSGLVFLLYCIGAAKLAYGRSGSTLLAIGAFIFSPFYYPYYAFTQPASMVGAARFLRKMW